ncbi:Sensitive to high expression protein 9-like protein, mitochondrial [Exophiala dermatitidis]
MQQAPIRLSQTIWAVFRASKPASKACLSRPRQRQFSSVVRGTSSQPWTRQRSRIALQARFYSDSKSDIEKKVEDAKSRIDESLEARADVAATEGALKHPQHETIVHTIPESSSIVHTSNATAGQKEQHRAQSQSQSQSQSQTKAEPPFSSWREKLPSDLSARYSHLRTRFTHFMDNFQTHIFTASRRLNDLTGYSGIEALKNEIERQEAVVQECRQAVKHAREKYTQAIATRSTTQREVNDLLHRKHTWSPTDLERFTSLYRSDHANEQAEAAAAKEVADAEARYEEASTRLARAILARYHEEQIWSDKIRQMSTWGTWGLMGLNVLLFVVFQIAIEPWRRKRLVKGFEEKVELALKETIDEINAGPVAQSVSLATQNTQPAVQPNEEAAVAALSPGEKVEAVADKIAEQIVDAVSGASDTSPTEEVASPPLAASTSPEMTTATATDTITPTSSPPPDPAIEAAAEQLTTEELAAEEIQQESPAETTTIIPQEPLLSPTGTPPSGTSRWVPPTSPLAWYEDRLRALFSDEHLLTLTQRQLTTIAMEGVAGGMALMGLLFVLFRPK